MRISCILSHLNVMSDQCENERTVKSTGTVVDGPRRFGFRLDGGRAGTPPDGCCGGHGVLASNDRLGRRLESQRGSEGCHIGGRIRMNGVDLRGNTGYDDKGL